VTVRAARVRHGFNGMLGKMWNKIFRKWWRIALQSRKKDKTQGAEAKRAARRKDGGSR